MHPGMPYLCDGSVQVHEKAVIASWQKNPNKQSRAGVSTGPLPPDERKLQSTHTHARNMKEKESLFPRTCSVNVGATVSARATRSPCLRRDESIRAGAPPHGCS